MASNEKISQLIELETPATADLLAIIDDASGTPTSKKVTLANIDTLLSATTKTLTHKTLTTPTITNPTVTTGAFTSPVLTTPQINDTSADHQYIVGVSELEADRTMTLPLLTGNDEFVFKAHTQTLTNKTLTSAVLNTGVSGTAVLDEDDLASNSATKVATQQSIKAYIVSGTVAMSNKTLTASTLEGNNNVVVVKAKDSGGTARNIAKVNASNVLEIGDAAIASYIKYNSPSVIKSTAKARAYLSNNMSAPDNNVWTKVTLDAEDYDPGGNFDKTTNHRFVAPVDGVYIIEACVHWSAVVANKRYLVGIYKNGVVAAAGDVLNGSGGTYVSTPVSTMLELSSGDYIELWVRSNDDAGTTIPMAGSAWSYLCIHLLSI